MNIDDFTKINSKCLNSPNFITHSLISFAESLIEANDVPCIVERAIHHSRNIFQEVGVSFYHYDDLDKRIIFYRIINDTLEAKAITDDKLRTRLKKIVKPEVRKRSISLRKNIPTVVFPFEITKIVRYLI